MCKENHTSLLDAFISNWRSSELSIFQKSKMLLKNTWTKIRNRDSCCGRPGEVGC